MATVIAVSAAPGATCCFACAAVVQHRAARDAGGTALTPAPLYRSATAAAAPRKAGRRHGRHTPRMTHRLHFPLLSPFLWINRRPLR